jgi:hypothetical protein
MTKSLICRIFPKLEIPAGGDRTDPAERPDALRSLRLLALREADREADRDLAASGDGRFAALVVAAFVAGFGVSTEEASAKSHWKGFNHVSTQQIRQFLYLRVLTRSTDFLDFFTPLLTRPIMHCTRTMPQSHPRSSSMAAAPEHWHCQQ